MENNISSSYEIEFFADAFQNANETTIFSIVCTISCLNIWGIFKYVFNILFETIFNLPP